MRLISTSRTAALAAVILPAGATVPAALLGGLTMIVSAVGAGAQRVARRED
jgi:hypothetical protein